MILSTDKQTRSRTDNLSSHTGTRKTQVYEAAAALSSPYGGASRHGVSRQIWTAQSGPLVTGRVTMKWVERLLHNSTLRWSHSSSTPHSRVLCTRGTTTKVCGPAVDADAVDAAVGRLKRGLHRQARAARRRARWSSLKLPPCSRRPLSQLRRTKMITASEVRARLWSCHARGPLADITCGG